MKQSFEKNNNLFFYFYERIGSQKRVSNYIQKPINLKNNISSSSLYQSSLEILPFKYLCRLPDNNRIQRSRIPTEAILKTHENIISKFHRFMHIKDNQQSGQTSFHIICSIMKKQELQQRYNKAVSKADHLSIQTRTFQELLMFMEHKIRNQIKKFSLLSLCTAERSKFMVQAQFQKAFAHLSLSEKIRLYEYTIQISTHIKNSLQQRKEAQQIYQVKQFHKKLGETAKISIQIQNGFRSWKQIHLNIVEFKAFSHQLQFDIRNYILRNSKCKRGQCFVLQAIHPTDPKILRFYFSTNEEKQQYLPLIKDLIDKGYTQMIQRMCKKQVTAKSSSSSASLESEQPQIQKKGHLSSQQENYQPSQKMLEYHPQTHIIQEILKLPEDQNLDHQLSQIVENVNQNFQSGLQQTSKTKNTFQHKNSYHKNIFSLMLPYYNLTTLDNFDNFELKNVTNKENFRIFQNKSNPLVFKLQGLLNNLEASLVVQILTNLHLYKNWHAEISQGQIKLNILSQNSAICYQKHKAYSVCYRQRDFLYLRHLFKIDNCFFIADKSIESTNFIPLNTIQRGKIDYQIMKIIPVNSGSQLIIQCCFEYKRKQSHHHAIQFTKRYLAGFQTMPFYFSKQQSKSKLKSYLKNEWLVQTQLNKQLSSPIQPRTQQQQSQIHDSYFRDEQTVNPIDSETFYSISQNQQLEENRQINQASLHQLGQNQAQPINTIGNISTFETQTNEQGFVILPKQYLTVRHLIDFNQQKQKKKVKHNFDDYLLKDIWSYLQEGGLKLINKKIIETQDSVISFILNKLKKNLFSGKGGLNISLPVTVFSSDSYLTRYCRSLGNAPQLLEKAAQLKDPAQRFKLSMLFGLTVSLLFLDIEKPFNPILGETYQCYIAGYPVYAQQICHHPPISAILMYGRGYKIHSCLQSIANFHLNSADGINKGWHHIVFNDNQQIRFHTPPAEFSGLSYGDRKFQFMKKGFYFDMKNCLFSIMSFQDSSGMLSKNKWKYKDQVFAQLFTVKPQFLKKFMSEFQTKKHSPSSKDVQKSHGKLSGRWTHQIAWNGQKMYSFNDNLPYQLNQYQNPLPSNSRYRQDLYYRSKNDLARSQIEKQRLQNIQRADIKLREKYGSKMQR